MPKPSSARAALTLPKFAPVPRAKERHNGWKPEVQRAFIEALAETGSVRSACARVGRADHGAYMLRRHPKAEEFRRASDVALDIGMRRIEDVAMDRALHGVETPVYSYGKIVGTRTVYNDRLLMFMLRNRAPERFTGGRAKAMNAIDAAELKRLKAQWRKEWEAERAKASHDPRSTIEAINAKLETVHRNRRAAMTRATRALHDAWQAALAADQAAGRFGSNEADDDHPQTPDEQIAAEWARSNVTRRIEQSDYAGDEGPDGEQAQ